MTGDQAPSFPTVDVRGLAITACRLDDVRAIIQAAIDGRTPAQALATVNLDFLRLADGSPDFRAALQGCGHRFADGWPVLELARLAGTTLPERVTGSDLTPRICAWAGAAGWRLAFVGADATVRDRLAELVPRTFGATVVGHWTPMYSPTATRDAALAAEIRARGADVVLVALSAPKGEFWMRDNLADCGAKAAIGIGASLDFLAGRVARAPRLVQRLRGEFLWRLLREPRRLGSRYWNDYWFWRRARREAVAAGAAGEGCAHG